MPETDNFDLSSLASILQNEDTLRSLRQMAGAMGMENQLEGALQNLSQSQAASGNSNSAPPSHPHPAHRQENHHQPNHQNVAQSQAQPDNAAGMNLNSLLSNPALLRTLSSVMQAMNQQGPEYLFLKSLKPLLRPEKAPRVDQAMQIMQMVKALESVEGGGLSGLAGLLGSSGSH